VPRGRAAALPLKPPCRLLRTLSGDKPTIGGNRKTDARDPYRPFAAVIDALRKGHSPLMLAALDKADFDATGNVE
jgi:hypothetical protein